MIHFCPKKNRETKHCILVNCSIKGLGSLFIILQLVGMFSDLEKKNLKRKDKLKIMLSLS